MPFQFDSKVHIVSAAVLNNVSDLTNNGCSCSDMQAGVLAHLKEIERQGFETVRSTPFRVVTLRPEVSYIGLQY